MKSNKICLVGGVDSIGVPYTRDNKGHIGFYELIEEKLLKDNEVISLNCFHMSTNNDNEYVRTLLTHDITLGEVRKSQNEMLKKCKYSGLYPYLELPKHFLGFYKNDGNDELIVRDCIKKHDTVFIYSAFVNDLLKKYELSLFKLLRPGKIQQELKDVDLSEVLMDIRENLELIHALNPGTQVYIIGLFVPTKVPYVRRSLYNFILHVDQELKYIARQHENVHFVDNSNLEPWDFNDIDFHPNRCGHEKIYENFMKVYRDEKSA